MFWLVGEAPAHLLSVTGRPTPSPTHVESGAISPIQRVSMERRSSAPADNPHAHPRAVLSAFVVHPNRRTSDLLCSTRRLWGITSLDANSVEAACHMLQHNREVETGQQRQSQRPAQILLID